MLTDADLPEPWRVVHSPIDQSHAERLDAVGHVEVRDAAHVSWDLIENLSTGRRALLRMAPDENGSPAVTGLYLPAGPPGPLGIGEIRNLPLAAIESSARGRRAEAEATIRASLVAGPETDSAELGRPSGPNDQQFFARLALRYVKVARDSTRPATDLAEAEGVTARTVQRWTSRARELGLLPAGRPGRTS